MDSSDWSNGIRYLIFEPDLTLSSRQHLRECEGPGWRVVWANASLDPCLFIENDRGGVIDSGARQGLTLVHFPAHRKRFPRDRGCM
jgi:hypothetical protein